MAYVQRLPDGRITGVYAVLQEGIAEEFVPDTDPAVIDHLANGLAKTPAEQAAADAEAARQATIIGDTGRADLLNRLKTASAAQIDTWLTNNVTTLAQARAVLAAIIKVIALDHRD